MSLRTRPADEEEEDYFGVDDPPPPRFTPKRPRTPEFAEPPRRREREEREERPKRKARLRLDLPDDLPVLCKDDLVASKAQEKEGGDRWTVHTWIEKCLPPEFYDRAVRNKLAGVIMDETWKAYGYFGIAPPFIPLDDVAAIWNLALKALGYTVHAANCVVLGDKKRKKKDE